MEDGLIIEKIHACHEGGFSIGYIKRTEVRRSDGFCFFLSGSADYIFGNNTVSVSEGDFLYLPEGGDYNFLVKEPLKYICIDFSFNKNGGSPFAVKNQKHIKNDFYKFLYNWLSPTPIKIPKSYEIINRIFCEIINAKNKNYRSSYRIFLGAMEIIVKRYASEDLTVEALAAEVGVSSVHLRRIFSDSVGASPKKIINDYRLEQAKILLTSSNLTVNEIAAAVGFCDQFHFSKSFKDAVGISPTEFRKKE